jgi:hypothetical protein
LAPILPSNTSCLYFSSLHILPSIWAAKPYPTWATLRGLGLTCPATNPNPNRNPNPTPQNAPTNSSVCRHVHCNIHVKSARCGQYRTYAATRYHPPNESRVRVRVSERPSCRHPSTFRRRF